MRLGYAEGTEGNHEWELEMVGGETCTYSMSTECHSGNEYKHAVIDKVSLILFQYVAKGMNKILETHSYRYIDRRRRKQFVHPTILKTNAYISYNIDCMNIMNTSSR